MTDEEYRTTARRAGWRNLAIQAAALLLFLAGIFGLVWGFIGAIVETAP